MNRLIYAKSEISADLYYATSFLAPDPFLYFTDGNRSFAVLNDLEDDRGHREATVDQVLSYSVYRNELEKKLRRQPSVYETILFILKKYGIKKAVVPADFPFSLAAWLMKSGVKLSVPKGVFFPERAFKEDFEVQEIEKASKAAAKLIDRVRKILKSSRIGPGKKLKWNGKVLTAECIRTEVQLAAFQMGAIVDHPIIAGGVQGCDPHERGHGPLKANELIVVDIFPQMKESRYWGDMTRTFVKGRPTHAQRKLFDTVYSAQKLALRVIRGGINAEKVHSKVADYFEKRGYGTKFIEGHRQGFFHGTGHGLGLEIHEEPRIGFRCVDRLKAGNVVTVEPGLYYPAIGGVRIEDVVLVTRQGCKKLSNYPVNLEV